MRDGLSGILFKGLRLFGDSLDSRDREGGLSDLRLADGLITLVDEFNSKGVSPLAR